MRNIRAPKLRFGPWTAWRERNSIPDANCPGVYLLRIGKRRFTGQNASVAQSHYIGMTNSHAGLKGRWSQLNRAIHGNGGHSGGNLIYSRLGHYDTWSNSLFVAAMPIACDTLDPTPRDYRLMGVVAYLEYEAFSVFRRSHPRLKKPRFNTR